MEPFFLKAVKGGGLAFFGSLGFPCCGIEDTNIMQKVLLRGGEQANRVVMTGDCGHSTNSTVVGGQKGRSAGTTL